MKNKNKNEVVTLNIAEKGLNTFIYDWYIEEDVAQYDGDMYILKEGGYGIFEPNCTWFAVQVRRQDVDEYLNLYTEYLKACWEPNQDWDTREYNDKLIKKLKKEMKALEVTATSM